MDPGMSALHDEAKQLLPDVIALRRRIHQSPELGLELPRTRQAVLDALDGLDLEISTGGRTSAVVATLRGARPGPTLLLRADMDALPMKEDTDLPFASQRDDAMHACGHDAHVAMLAGAAQLLARRRDEIAGSLKLLFQPGEEGFAGAKVLIDEGLLDTEPKVDAAFAIHVDSLLPAGAVATRAGALLAAADLLSIDLTGKGGHASMPHLAVDPIPVACEIVMALQSFVTRRVDAFDPAVVTITRLTAGSAGNVIPESANLLGTIRTISERTRREVHEGVRRLATGIAQAHGVEAKVHLLSGYPPTLNHDAFTGFARETAARVVGDERLIDMRAPIMGAEDFSYVLQRVPGAMVFLGVRPLEGATAPLHSNRMRLEESALATGVVLHAAIALAFSERGGRV